ncbi:MAG: site-2 protease family protein [Bacteroidales bacterium]|nr:site-2 protease family protein [Bacteroidales bacterium]
MLLLAILIHVLGHYIPSLFTGEKLKDLRTQFTWKQIFYEMSGVITCFVMAFIIITIITLTTKEHYLLNENAIYGIECSPYAKEIGFKDGDKIISINDEKVERFDDIIKTILIYGQANVLVQRDDEQITVVVSETTVREIIKSPVFNLFEPKSKPDSISGIDQLVYEESRQGFQKAFQKYLITVETVYRWFFPRKIYNQIGGFGIIGGIYNFKGLLYLLSMSLIFVGFLNLLPIPGLDIGNVIFAMIEKGRKKKFNRRGIKITKIICISLLVLFFVVMVYFR